VKKLAAGCALGLMVLAASGCSGGSKPAHHGPVKLPVGPPGTSSAGVLRLGYLVSADDAPALVGTQLGIFQRALGRATLQAEPFASPATEAAALEEGQLDAAYLDPVTVVAVSQASHAALRIVCGSAAGGAELVVRKNITGPAQLRGTALAAPAGVLQAAADSWLSASHLAVLSREEVAPSTDAGIVHEFKAGAIAGAWEPAPLDAELMAAGGRVLAGALGSGGRMPTAVLAVTSRYLRTRPAVVRALIKGQLQAEQFLAADKASAIAAFSQSLRATEHETLTPAVLTSSFAQVTFTADPMAAGIRAELRQAAAAGIIRNAASWPGVFELEDLNALLAASGKKPVQS